MFTKGFRRGQLRIKAIENLQEQEMSLLPQTMQVITEMDLRATWDKLQDEFYTLVSYIGLNPLEPIDYKALESIQDKMRATGLESGTVAKKAKREIVRTTKCPKPECLGYIAMSGPGSGSCGLCKSKVCRACNKALLFTDTTVHECLPDDVASWALIKDSSKACPKCGTHIEKVSGCNQMWCTVSGCNTAFDWATERIINGPVHNPHYHEWLRNGNNAPEGANLLCEGPREIINGIRLREIYDYFITLPKTPNEMWYNRMTQWLRALPEVIDIRYNLNEARYTAYTPESHQDLRIKYLRGNINKAKWASQLSHRETSRVKHQRLLQIQTMFQTAASDVFLKLHTDTTATAARLGVTRLRHGVQVLIVPGSEALALIEPFYNALESLRRYVISETVKVLLDYSDTSVRVLEWMPIDDLKTQFQLVYTKLPMSELVLKYLKASI